MERTTAMLLSLLRAAVLGEPRSLSLTEGEAGALLALARHHDLGHLLCLPLEAAGTLPTDGWGEEWRTSRLMAVSRSARLMAATERITAALDEAGIAYVPLKGAVLSHYYPEPWYRTSCDLDLLVREEDLERALALIEAREGARRARRTYHDVSLTLADGSHVELHFSLAENVPTMDRVLARAWEHAHPVRDGACRHAFTEAFLAFYAMAHTAYHFKHGGCGVRPLLDLYLLKQNAVLDAPDLLDLLADAGLLPFAEAAMRLSDAWFGGAVHTDLTLRMSDYILRSGTYGRLDSRVAIATAGQGRFRYLCRRIFLPPQTLSRYYPRLDRHRWLYPLYTVRRWLEILFTRRRRCHAAREIFHSTALREKTAAPLQALCRELEL